VGGLDSRNPRDLDLLKCWSPWSRGVCSSVVFPVHRQLLLNSCISVPYLNGNGACPRIKNCICNIIFLIK
jgi:hypothetical protein